MTPMVRGDGSACRLQAFSPSAIFLIGIFVLYNNDTFLSVNHSLRPEPVILLFILLICVTFVREAVSPVRSDPEALVFVGLMIAATLSTMLLTGDVTGGYFKIILIVLMGWMLSRLVSFGEAISSYILIMVLLSGYSLVMLYVMRPFVEASPHIIFPRFANSEGLPFINARFTYIVDVENYYRNFGIFREPGVYQVFLNFAIMFELFFKKARANLLFLCLLYAGLISTFSPPGYIGGLFLGAAYMVGARKISYEHKKRFLVLLVVFIFSVAALFVFNDGFNTIVTESIVKLVARESSFQGRLVAILANLEAWAERPFFGGGITYGLTGLAMQKMLYSFGYSTAHNTSTIGAYLAAFGFFFTLLYIALLIKLIARSGAGVVRDFIMFFVVMLSINTQLLIYSELLYMLLFLGFCKATSPDVVEGGLS